MASRSSAAYGTAMARGIASWRFSTGGARRFRRFPDLDIDTMWEVEGHYQPELQGPAGQLGNPMIHEEATSLHGMVRSAQPLFRLGSGVAGR